jgi:antitoxin HicB
MLYAYPYDVTAEPGGGFSATFSDVPGAMTQADSEADLEHQAEDALVSALAALVEDGEAIPEPSDANGRPVAIVPALEAAKLALHSAMVGGKVSNVALAQRLEMDERAVRRLRDVLHRSHIEQVEAALRALGKRVSLQVMDAA